MKSYPSLSAGDNFFVICYNCGRISYAHKSTALFCQTTDDGSRATCNPAYHSRGKRACYNWTITTCFGEQVNIDDVIAHILAYYEKSEGEWSLPIPARMFFLFGQYHGPLPQGTETIIVGGYAIRKVRREISGDVAYLVKPYIYLKAEEREVRRNLIVKGVVTTFYQRKEEHPLAEVAIQGREGEIHLEDVVFWCCRNEERQQKKQQKAAAAMSGFGA